MRAMEELHALPADALRPGGLLCGDQPVVLRGLVGHWPLVQQARRSNAALGDYLAGFCNSDRLSHWISPPEAGGRFGFRDDFSGFNFERRVGPFRPFVDELLGLQGQADAPALYMGSTELDACFPGLREANPLPALDERAPLVSLWLGNRSCASPHFDLPDNLACVVAGRRRFTLFPPDQVDKLYIGPLDLAPAGQPISLVDLRAPDFERFPRYRDALRHAQVAELAPGDAIFIPSQWWHGVEGLEDVNALVNCWWRQSPAHMDTPFNALMLALLSVRDLPPAQRQAWRCLFDHYVFDADADTAAHLPEHARGVLGPIDERMARRLRSVLLNRLNR